MNTNIHNFSIRVIYFVNTMIILYNINIVKKNYFICSDLRTCRIRSRSFDYITYKYLGMTVLFVKYKLNSDFLLIYFSFNREAQVYTLRFLHINFIRLRILSVRIVYKSNVHLIIIVGC